MYFLSAVSVSLAHVMASGFDPRRPSLADDERVTIASRVSEISTSSHLYHRAPPCHRGSSGITGTIDTRALWKSAPRNVLACFMQPVYAVLNPASPASGGDVLSFSEAGSLPT